MSNKLTFSDIVDLFATKTGQTKKESELFLRELLDVMSSKMCEDGLLKVRDFGTFKVVEVDSRESVDVNTGAKIEIAFHKKFSFVPDKTLKDLVNKPFSLFEPELLKEGVNFEQMELEISSDEDSEDTENGFAADSGHTEVSETSKEQNENTEEEQKEETEISPNETERVAEKEQPRLLSENRVHQVLADFHPTESSSSDEDAKPLGETAPTTPKEENAAQPELFSWNGQANASDEDNSSNLGKVWKIVAVCLVLLLISGFAFYFFNNDADPLAPGTAQNLTVPAAHPTEDSISKTTPPTVKIDTIVTHEAAAVNPQKKDTTQKEKPEASGKTKQEDVKSLPATPHKAVTEITRAGSTFRTLALKHYGSKEFWVYIYQANKAKVPHPNLLRSGTAVIIPDAATLGINVSDPASLRRAKQLSTEILNEK